MSPAPLPSPHHTPGLFQPPPLLLLVLPPDEEEEEDDDVDDPPDELVEDPPELDEPPLLVLEPPLDELDLPLEPVPAPPFEDDALFAGSVPNCEDPAGSNRSDCDAPLHATTPTRTSDPGSKARFMAREL